MALASLPIIQDTTSGGQFGQALGTGLAQMANVKAQHLQKQYDTQLKNQETKGLATLFAQNGYDEKTSNLLAQLTQYDPKTTMSLLGTLGAGGYGQQQGLPGQEGLPGQPGQEGPPQKNFAQALAQGAQQEKITPAELKHRDTIIEQQTNLEDLIATTDRAIKALESGKVNVGVIPSLKAGYAPTWLDKITEGFDKDSARIINLTSAKLKGVPSKFRVQLLEKEKFGVKHSIPVNLQIARRYNKDAKHALAVLQKNYPYLSELSEKPEVQAGNAKTLNALTPETAKKYPNKRVQNPRTGEISRSNGLDWIPEGQ